MIPIPSVITAFIAGLLSIFTPCVLPLIPSYISYIAGISLSDKYLAFNSRTRTLRIFLHSVVFAIGFVGIFIIVGASIGFISKLFLLNRREFQIAGGIIIILLGIAISGAVGAALMPPLRRPFFKERRLRVPQWVSRFDYLRSFIIGVIFSVGWSPCYGPILGVIITLAATHGSTEIGMALLGIYGFGFMLPFLIGSLFIAAFTNFVKNFSAKLQYIKWVASIFLIILGILLVTGDYNDFVTWIILKYQSAGIELL